MRALRVSLVVAVGSLSAACGSVSGPLLDGYQPASLDSAPRIQRLSQASAAWVSAAGGIPSTTDMTCPHQEVHGDTTTFTGGCTDSAGVEWFGTATARADGGNHISEIHFEDYGSRRTRMCSPSGGGPAVSITERQINHGSTHTDGAGTNNASFHVDLTVEGEKAGDDCVVGPVTLAISYEGTVARSGVDMNMDGTVDTATYNGHGRFGTSAEGVVDAITTNEVLDSNVCNDEAISGTTQLSANGHSAVITYDGATDCSMDHTVTWTYDGMSRGTLTGVACGVGHPSRSGLAWWSSAIAIAACAMASRRRRTSG